MKVKILSSSIIYELEKSINDLDQDSSLPGTYLWRAYK